MYVCPELLYLHCVKLNVSNFDVQDSSDMYMTAVFKTAVSGAAVSALQICLTLMLKAGLNISVVYMSAVCVDAVYLIE